LMFAIRDVSSRGSSRVPQVIAPADTNSGRLSSLTYLPSRGPRCTPLGVSKRYEENDRMMTVGMYCDVGSAGASHARVCSGMLQSGLSLGAVTVARATSDSIIRIMAQTPLLHRRHQILLKTQFLQMPSTSKSERRSKRNKPPRETAADTSERRDSDTRTAVEERTQSPQVPASVDEEMEESVEEDTTGLFVTDEDKDMADQPSSSAPGPVDELRRSLPDLTKPGGWGDDAIDKANRDADKAARKATKKEKRAAAKAANVEAAEKRRAAGQPPNTPCANCAGPHWTQECDQPKKPQHKRSHSTATTTQGLPEAKKTKGKGKALDNPPESSSSSRKPSVTPATGESRGATPLSRNPEKGLTRRAEKAKKGSGITSSIYQDGTYTYLKFPSALRGDKLPPPSEIITALTKAGIDTGVKQITPHDKDGGTLVRYHDSGQAIAAAGTNLTFGKTTVPLRPYYTSGSQVFLAAVSGPFGDIELAHAISTHIKGHKFWYGKEELRGIRLGKTLLVFETAPNFYKFDVVVGQNHPTTYTVKFLAVDLAGACSVCTKAHAVTACPDIQPLILAAQVKLDALLETQPPIRI